MRLLKGGPERLSPCLWSSVVKRGKREGPELRSCFSDQSFYHLELPFLTLTGQQVPHSLPAAVTKASQAG